MKKWAKINRATGDVLKYKREKELKRNLTKKYVWVEEVIGTTDVIDSSTHKLSKIVILPDLSDLSTPVGNDVKRVINFQAVALTPREIQDNNAIKISNTDHGLIRALEDILVIIAQGTPLTRENIPPEVISKVNERRAFRGEAPV